MSLPPSFDEYKDKYEHVKLERENGILTLTLHTNGNSIEWGYEPHHELGYAFQDIGNDDENKVIVVTGTGDAFINRDMTPDVSKDGPGDGADPSDWAHVVLADGYRIQMAHLTIPQPMIAAVNGPLTIHPEMALLCDIVIASDTAEFGDPHHFKVGAPPGDGVQVIWPELIGINRARYLLLTGQKLDAQKALEWGVINEVLPKDKVLDRAYDLAKMILERPQLTVRLTREVMLRDLKRTFQDNVTFGLALEGLAVADYFPWGKEFGDGEQVLER